ncbi:MAG TPA: hypothetical protein VID75_10575 [Acidimicrobiales bacterium]|jgi:hypothetical protein
MEKGSVERGWERIADDLFATIGLSMSLRIRRGAGDWWDVEVFLDEGAVGTFGRTAPSGEEDFIVALADGLCEFTFDGQVWPVWPICPDHNTHPLEAMLDENRLAVWRCPVGRVVARVGDLSA